MSHNNTNHSKIHTFLTDKESRFSWYINRRKLLGLPYEEQIIKHLYKNKMGKKLNLKKPRTLCEKLQWLKLYDRKPEYTGMVDKYEAKSFVTNRVGVGHVIPTLGVWDHVDDIDFDKLPNQFVLKPTHDSGGLIICRDKSELDIAEAKRKLNNSLSNNFYYAGYEWPYKHVKPRIIAEPLIDQLGKPDSIEYKTTCFNGKVGFVTICRGIAHAEFDKRTNDHFDRDFKKMNWYTFYKPANVTPKKPEQWNELIVFCEKLAKGVPYLRVDTYIIDGKILFGEMTFFTWGGYMKFEPEEWDLKLGQMLELPKEKMVLN